MTPFKFFAGVLATASAALALAAPSVPAPLFAAGPVQGSVATGGRFDLSVNNAPAAQVFMQIGSGTPYNMLVAPDVAGTISITLKDTTVLEALESLRELYGYDYRVAGNRIFVQPNTVTTRLFKINYLPGRRQGASDIRVTSSSISQSGAGSNSASGSSSFSSCIRVMTCRYSSVNRSISTRMPMS